MSHSSSDTKEYVSTLCATAIRARRALGDADHAQRTAALLAAAARLRERSTEVVAANARDLDAARSTGLSSAMIDRLALDSDRIAAIADGIDQVARLPDPLAAPIAEWTTARGLDIRQMRIPIGVIAVIYESRPNVTADVAALCLKSGNACILKGGKEAIHTNTTIAEIMREALEECGVIRDAVQIVDRTDRDTTAELLKRDDAIDVIVPRGGPSLVRAIAEGSRIPVIKHYEGVCSVYVDAAADLQMASDIALNAKVQRPGVCNAMENLVVHQSVASTFLPMLAQRLGSAGVELRADEAARTFVPDSVPATDADWSTEYLDLVLAIKTVESADQAVDFINQYGSGHSDAIVTNDIGTAARFLARVDSAAVYHNASTRFTDGFEFGFGAEVGISTNRLHARGPMGLRELTTYKYIIRGEGQVR